MPFLYAEIHQAVIVWRIVVFADARHVLETCLAQRERWRKRYGRRPPWPVTTIQYSPGFQPDSSNFGLCASSRYTSLSREVENQSLPLLGCGEAERAARAVAWRRSQVESWRGTTRGCPSDNRRFLQAPRRLSVLVRVGTPGIHACVNDLSLSERREVRGGSGTRCSSRAGTHSSWLPESVPTRLFHAKKTMFHRAVHRSVLPGFRDARTPPCAPLRPRGLQGPALPRKSRQPWPGHHEVGFRSAGFPEAPPHTSLVVAVQNQILPCSSAAKLNGRTWGCPSTLVARYHAGTALRYSRIVAIPFMMLPFFSRG